MKRIVNQTASQIRSGKANVVNVDEWGGSGLGLAVNNTFKASEMAYPENIAQEPAHLSGDKRKVQEEAKYQTKEEQQEDHAGKNAKLEQGKQNVSEKQVWMDKVIASKQGQSKRWYNKNAATTDDRKNKETNTSSEDERGQEGHRKVEQQHWAPEQEKRRSAKEVRGDSKDVYHKRKEMDSKSKAKSRSGPQERQQIQDNEANIIWKGWGGPTFQGRTRRAPRDF